MRRDRLWTILLVLGISPWLFLAALGGWHLWQSGQLWLWLLAAAVLSAAAWMGARSLRRRKPSPAFELPRFEPDQPWSPAAKSAWAKVEKTADDLKPEEFPLGEPDRYLALAARIAAEVARHFHPATARAELDVSLPALMLIVERVSRDMRELLVDQVPGSHLMTLRDALDAWRWRKKLGRLGAFAAVGKLLSHPAGGGLSAAFFGQILRYPMEELERWLLQTLARKIGYYSILLYGGHTLDQSLQDKLTPESARDLASAEQLARRPSEPLRILVAGQTKAGKSSLVNALFGELRACADALPSTRALTPYRLEKEGEFLALVFDSPGYGDVLSWAQAHGEELNSMDLILLACNATHAGRAADLQFLETLHRHFAETADRAPPPIIVALSHIDLLRPMREWDPPYNLAHPENAKAVQIRACMEEAARSLEIPLERIQAACLKPGEEWNVEAVWACLALHLPLIRRAHYLRCLKDARAREKWELILRQLTNAGRMIVEGIGKVLPGK